jgi:hypothetical protein
MSSAFTSASLRPRLCKADVRKAVWCGCRCPRPRPRPQSGAVWCGVVWCIRLCHPSAKRLDFVPAVWCSAMRTSWWMTMSKRFDSDLHRTARTLSRRRTLSSRFADGGHRTSPPGQSPAALRMDDIVEYTTPHRTTPHHFVDADICFAETRTWTWTWTWTRMRTSRQRSRQMKTET